MPPATYVERVLGRELETDATPQRIAQAIRDAEHGEATILACSNGLSVGEAVALAEQHRLLSRLEEAVRISAGHGRIHIEPTDTPVRRRIPGAPGGYDRRSAFDRRIGERRQLAPDNPVTVAAAAVHGERRSGNDRRSGIDRRQRDLRRPRGRLAR